MTRRAAKTQSPSRRKKNELAPLDLKTLEGGGLHEWLARYRELPVAEQTNVIRQNPEAMALLYDNIMVQSGSLLSGIVAAEYGGDCDDGEYAFLTMVKPFRDRLIRDYQIKTAAEYMIVDAVVLSFHHFLRMASLAHSYAAYGKKFNYDVLSQHAQACLVRANEMFLRNLEALRQLKSSPLVVKIAQAGQVNVGERQLNVAAGTGDEACPEPGKARGSENPALGAVGGGEMPGREAADGG